MTIRSLTEANAALMSYAEREPKIGRNFTLERVAPLMAAAGNPQDRLRVVHIAGTSGKTSTAYYMAALLRVGGKKVGMTVSPHVDSVTERIQINGMPFDEQQFCRELEDFLEVVERSGQHPSYFELLYAFALWIFDRHKVDYAVLETGVGGLYDATNVTRRPDKVCVITDIGFDHTHLLGKTLDKIASQKIGIVHKHNHVFMYEQPEEAMDVIREWVSGHDATLHLVKEPKTRVAASRLADYQLRNWRLARQVYKHLEGRDGLKRLDRRTLDKTKTVPVPGRMDVRKVRGKTLVMDGAHNQQKMKAFIDSFKRLYPEVRPAILLSLKHNKDHEDITPLVVPFAGRIIVTSFDAIQDSKIRSMDPETLAGSLKAAGAGNVQVVPDQHQAFKTLLESPEKVCVATGSFYMLGQIRNKEGLS